MLLQTSENERVGTSEAQLLWRVCGDKSLSHNEKFLHGVQGVVSSNLVAPTIIKSIA
jgi:hypothetical protein